MSITPLAGGCLRCSKLLALLDWFRGLLIPATITVTVGISDARLSLLRRPVVNLEPLAHFLGLWQPSFSSSINRSAALPNRTQRLDIS